MFKTIHSLFDSFDINKPFNFKFSNMKSLQENFKDNASAKSMVSKVKTHVVQNFKYNSLLFALFGLLISQFGSSQTLIFSETFEVASNVRTGSGSVYGDNTWTWHEITGSALCSYGGSTYDACIGGANGTSKGLMMSRNSSNLNSYAGSRVYL